MRGGPSPRRIAFAAVFALCAGLSAIALLDGFHSSYPISLLQKVGLVVVGGAVIGGTLMAIGLRMADWRDPESEEDFDRIVDRSERLAREGLAADPEDEDALAEAVHRFLARAPSLLMLVQAEDLAGEIEQANLPGTVDEHPNWRRRLRLSPEELLASPLFRRIAAAVNEEGRR